MFADTRASRRGCCGQPAAKLPLLISLLYLVGAAQAINECMLAPSGVAATVSPIAEADSDGFTHRFVEIFWWGINSSDAENGWFGLWVHNPVNRVSEPADTAVFSGKVEGHLVFTAEFNSSLIPDDVSSILDPECLPYWVGYVENDIMVYLDCLKIQPHWMRRMQEKYGYLSDAHLTDVILPGSHDAGASYQYENWTSITTIDIIAQWTFTHHDGIYEQLVLGTRYLDIRIGYYPEKEHLYYLNHANIRILPLYIILEDVARFMSQTQEIVIFDIHHLENNFEDHAEALPGLLTLLESYFQKWMVPNSFQPNPTLGSLWATNDKRLLVTYPGSAPSNLYWKNVHHVWSNTDDLNDLIRYFDDNIPLQLASDSLWSVMGQFTPGLKDLIESKWGGLTGAANITNFPVTMKLRREWWSQVNIMAMDYILGSSVIDTIIEANELKFSCLRRCWKETFNFSILNIKFTV